MSKPVSPKEARVLTSPGWKPVETAQPLTEADEAWAILRNSLSKAYVAADIDAAIASARPLIEHALRAEATRGAGAGLPLVSGVAQQVVAVGNGDCLRACVATITGLDVPNLIESAKWHSLYREWLKERGWAFTDDDGSRPMLGFSVAVGPSPTFPGENHACVALDGVVIWDPSPHRDEPGRDFRPASFWPVFRLASGRAVYDPFTATSPQPTEEALDVERLMVAVFNADSPGDWPKWDDYIAAFGSPGTPPWRRKAEKIAAEYAALTEANHA